MVIYRPGEKNMHAYLLSRRWDNALKEGGEPSPVGFFKTEQYVSNAVSGSNENPVESETAETANGVFKDTADGIVVLSSMSIAAASLESPRNSRSSCQRRLERTATLLHRCNHVVGADTTAEAVNGVFEDTADGIVALSSMSIAAAKEMELSFKLSAAAGRRSHACASMQTCGWCRHDG
jgi:hypothetical protein